MSEVFKEEQDFFNLLIEETYQVPVKLNSHLSCYSTTVNLSQQLMKGQVVQLRGQYQKSLKCFRFKTPLGLIDFPQNWGPFARALFYFDNNEQNFYGTYDADTDHFAFCKMMNFAKVVLFSQGEVLCIAGFKAGQEEVYQRFVNLFGPREIKTAA